MVSTRNKKRKVDEPEEPDSATKTEEQEPELEAEFTRGSIWYEDGSVVLVTAGNVGFKVGR